MPVYLDVSNQHNWSKISAKLFIIYRTYNRISKHQSICTKTTIWLQPKLERVANDAQESEKGLDKLDRNTRKRKAKKNQKELG